MIHRLAVLAIAIGAAFGVLVPPAAAATNEIVSIELVGNDGTRFVVDDRPYAGPILVTAHADGLSLAERANIEQYLNGIAEMPFDWSADALEAQAVAARTYVTRTLQGGRRGDAARYGYDICATSWCQVYRGTLLVEGGNGSRWKDAVAATANELVLHEGRPIEAVYTSMVGSRSRANQDVWSSDPVPYLQPVDSPEVGTAPFATWQVNLLASQFVAILRADGLDVGGDLIAIELDDPPEGAGRAELTVITTGGTDSILAPALKGSFNRHGDDLYPGALPAELPDGTRLPQPLPSYTYEIDHEIVPERPFDRFLPADERVARDRVVIDGEGWGHGVGMSQWGARVMADAGSTHDEILTHFYTGTTVEVAPELVPDSVVVGLVVREQEIEVVVDGGAALLVNGVPFTSIPSGEWLLRRTLAGIALIGLTPGQPTPPIGDRHWPR